MTAAAAARAFVGDRELEDHVAKVVAEAGELGPVQLQTLRAIFGERAQVALVGAKPTDAENGRRPARQPASRKNTDTPCAPGRRA
jgi:hypothetical protein